MTRAWVSLLPIFLLTVKVAGGQSRDWQAEWEKIVKAAKAEREVAVGSEPAVDNQNALMEFSKAYPDCKDLLNKLEELTKIIGKILSTAKSKTPFSYLVSFFYF